MIDDQATSAIKVSFDGKFFERAAALAPADSRRVFQAIDKFLGDPYHPSLNLEKLSAVQITNGGSVYSIRASERVRILLEKVNHTWVFLYTGAHDDVYRFASRMVGRNLSTGALVVRDRWEDEASSSGSETPIEPTRRADASTPDSPGMGGSPVATGAASRHFRSEGPKYFDHWSDRELVELAHFQDWQVADLRSCRTDDDLLALVVRPGWNEEWVEYALEVACRTPEQWRQGSLFELAAAAERVQEILEKNAYYAGYIGPLDAEEARKLLSAPVEDWMVYLHPEQAEIVRATFKGPARVRGPAGTGKTVVALHRAAELGKRYERGWAPRRDCRVPPPGPPVLFTTFVRSLVNNLRNLCHRLPRSKQDSVDFRTVDSLARHVCDSVGESWQVADRNSLDHTFAVAWRSVVTPGSPIQRLRLSRKYVMDEIVKVVKGRGIASLGEYMEARRPGREVPLDASAREHVWELMTMWDRELRQLGLVTFADITNRACSVLESQDDPLYRCAIVDEAQDLTLAQLRLVLEALPRGSSADLPDTLMLVGDGAQRIYPGGYTLAEAGVDVRGRSKVLRLVYRSTRQIMTAAREICADRVEDLDETFDRAADPVVTGPPGASPQLWRCWDEDSERRCVVGYLREFLNSDEIDRWGDMAVLLPTNEAVDRWVRALQDSQIPSVDLASMRFEEATPSRSGGPDGVWVGTFHRAKGMEFKIVFLPEMSEGKFPPPMDHLPPQEKAETERRYLSELYVAMTRARDALVITCVGRATDRIEKAVAQGLLEYRTFA